MGKFFLYGFIWYVIIIVIRQICVEITEFIKRRS